MLDLCTALRDGEDPTSISNLWFRDGKRVLRNEIRPVIEQLSDHPSPVRDIPTVTDYDQRKVADSTFFMGTRGCPYACSYCCNQSLKRTYPNPTAYYRFKSIDDLLSEVQAYVDANPRTLYLNFYDDVQMGNRKWFEAFCERYRTEVDRACFLTGRWELLTERNVELLKQIRCEFLLIGVESGDEVLRKQVLRRHQSDAMMLERASFLKRAKIRYGLFTMVGVPTETMASALKTVKLAARLTGNQLLNHHTIFYPFRGTPLYELCEQEGLISDREVKSYFVDTRLDMPQFPREEILFAHRRFGAFRIAYWLAAKLPGPIWRWAERQLDRLWLAGPGVRHS